NFFSLTRTSPICGILALMKTLNSSQEQHQSTRNLSKRARWRCGLLLVAFALTSVGLSPIARAVCQDGCLTNDNTVLGDDALLDVTTGNSNTAVGVDALTNNTTGSSN